MSERKHKSNAERQRAYRQRKRNAHPNEADRRDASIAVTVKTHHPKCGKRILLGDWGNGPVHALIISNDFCPPSRQCAYCDAHRPQ